jgi:formylglycine-generating enzyme required for sulfatase activity
MKLRRTFIKGRPEWNRVLRGGCWNGSASSLRAAYRHDDGPSSQYYYIGARLSKPKGGKDEA